MGHFSQPFFAPQPEPIPGYTVIAAGDFSGDGKPEVSFSRPGDFTGLIGEFASNGIATYTRFPIGSGFDVVQSGDLNGDGKVDLFLYSTTSGLSRTAISTGSGFTFTTASYSPGFTAVRLLDLNGDGKSDIVLYNKATSAGYYGIGAGDGTTGTAYSGLSNGGGGFTYKYSYWGPGRMLAR